MTSHPLLRVVLLALMFFGAFIIGQRHFPPPRRKRGRSGNTRLSKLTGSNAVPHCLRSRA